MCRVEHLCPAILSYSTARTLEEGLVPLSLTWETSIVTATKVGDITFNMHALYTCSVILEGGGE